MLLLLVVCSASVDAGGFYLGAPTGIMEPMLTVSTRQ
jgi:hypothetical protein